MRGLFHSLALVCALVAPAFGWTEEATSSKTVNNATPVPVEQSDRDRLLEGCDTPSGCFDVLVLCTPPDSIGRWFGDEERIADYFGGFGVLAKEDLWRRLDSPDPRLRDIASSVLEYWRDWSASDVPRLAAQLAKPMGYWTARPLARIGTPEAIQALVDGLTPHRAQSPVGVALAQLGARAMPVLLKAFSLPTERYAAEWVVAEMHTQRATGLAAAVAGNWVAIATDEDRARQERMGALRGLAAIGEEARPFGKPLHQLISSPDQELREQAIATLAAMLDPVALPLVAKLCRPREEDLLYAYAFEMRYCLDQIEKYGPAARRMGSVLTSYLSASSAAERMEVIETLATIGYARAIPSIERALQSRDWRVVVVAIDALVKFGRQRSLAALQVTADSYWLPHVRLAAQGAIDAIRRWQGIDNESDQIDSRGYQLIYLGSTPHLPDYRLQPCLSEHWRWGESDIRPPAMQSLQLAVFGGTVTREPIRGGFGGEGFWQGDDHRREIIRDEAFGGFMVSSNGDLIVLFGHGQGVIARARRLRPLIWDLHEIVRLPGRGDWLSNIGPDLYAVLSEDLVIVVSDEKILGVATCVQ